MGSIHILIDDALKERLDTQAAREERTMKAVVVRALERYLAAEEPKATKAHAA
jgi:predicted transcriptional regulator